MSKDRGNQRLIPTIRFKGFTDDWEQRKLGELADIARGASPRPIQDPKWFDDSSQVGWLRIADVTEQNGRIHHLEQHISKLGQEKTRVLAKPHLLLSIAATVGKPVVNYVKTGVHDGFLIFYDLKANREFVYQWLEMFRPLWQKYGQPGSQVNLNSELVKQQPIPLPSNDEQEKIVNILTSLDDTIALHQRKYENLQAVKKELLKRMFASDKKPVPDFRFNGYTNDWEQRKLGDVASIIGGGTPSTAKPEYWNGDIDWYAPAEIGSQRYVSESQKKITPAGLKASSARMLPIGTILFTSRAGIGNTAILAKEGCTNQGFQSIVPKPAALDSYFIFSRTDELKRYGQVNGAGSTFAEVSGKTMSKMPIRVPLLEEQLVIGGFFHKIDDALALHQRKLEDLKQLKKVLLQKLFV